MWLIMMCSCSKVNSKSMAQLIPSILKYPHRPSVAHLSHDYSRIEVECSVPDNSDRSRDRSPWGSCSIRGESSWTRGLSSVFALDRPAIVLDRYRSSRARQSNRDSRENGRADRCGDRIRRQTVRVLLAPHRLPIVDSRLNSRAPLAHSIAPLAHSIAISLATTSR